MCGCRLRCLAFTGDRTETASLPLSYFLVGELLVWARGQKSAERVVNQLALFGWFLAWPKVFGELIGERINDAQLLLFSWLVLRPHRSQQFGSSPTEHIFNNNSEVFRYDVEYIAHGCPPACRGPRPCGNDLAFLIEVHDRGFANEKVYSTILVGPVYARSGINHGQRSALRRRIPRWSLSSLTATLLNPTVSLALLTILHAAADHHIPGPHRSVDAVRHAMFPRWLGKPALPKAHTSTCRTVTPLSAGWSASKTYLFEIVCPDSRFSPAPETGAAVASKHFT